jgi:uncharacterized protein YndB with AHSA1/START domain
MSSNDKPDGNTVALHRVIKAKPEKVYRAFVEADAMEQWLPPSGFTATMHHIDAKVGGTYKMSFTNFGTGQIMGFGGTFLEMIPNEKLRYTDVFDDPNLPGEIMVTVTLRSVLIGTEIGITQSNLPSAIPVEMCYLGWQDSLLNLARLVEPEIS